MKSVKMPFTTDSEGIQVDKGKPLPKEVKANPQKLFREARKKGRA